mmetsp:Transcript_39016/g.94333  ORF Transcript_39016/g.94333 Transcript_39016/m.94333 type:complete len:174 (-) Transcript_39016:1371-1892(-)|eukprot:CAMPEP_0113616760 /NCGR_PEP_ID=MMETSP0017_2-20120614/8412_1 /TAXON_ID=2856 /ORGANISM="Cylindrotheca closterium" /LENGTH=173 /DNA_ID=CAMNT_0000526097 /DNA_START=102 /DNA_END=623 /DNA_ORIENTATION=- /assembly_acc=CAM_ASM_000147
MKLSAIVSLAFLVTQGAQAASLRGGRQLADDEEEEDSFVVLLESEECREFTAELLNKIETLQSFGEDAVLDFVCSDVERTLMKMNLQYITEGEGSNKCDLAFDDLLLQEQVKIVNAVGTEESCRNELSLEFKDIKENLHLKDFKFGEQEIYRPIIAGNAALALSTWQVRRGKD